MYDMYRGWISEENPGTNTSYYLYMNNCFFLISPSDYDTKSRSFVWRIRDEGRMGSLIIYDITGGVLVLKLCLVNSYQKKRLFFS